MARVAALLRSLWRNLVRRDRVERTLDTELRAYVELLTEENLRAGMTPEEARQAALLECRGIEQVKERVREAWVGKGLVTGAREVRYALRTVQKSPGFAVVAVLTLALGIGGVTAIFAFVNAIVIRPLPYPESNRLVAVKHAAPGLGLEEAGLSSGTFFHYRTHARSVESLALYQEAVANLSGGDAAAEQVQLAMAGPEFFRILGVRPALGRLFTQEDTSRGFMDVTWPIPVLLSHELWERRYGGDPGIVGRMITINASPREVVGVLPAELAFPRPGTDVWMLHVPPEVTASFADALDYDAIGRLRPGISPKEAEAELSRILPSIEGVYPDATAERLAQIQLRPIVVPLKDEVIGNVGTTLWILLGGMGFVLLVACANVANLFLLRADDRAREVALRMVLGACRADLVRLFLTESALLSFIGTIFGVLTASWGVSAVVAFVPVELPRLHEVRLDAWVLAFAASVAVLAALLLGVVSVLRQSRILALTSTLRSGGWGATASRERRRMRGSLVAAQVALALTLLVGSALMVQSFYRLMRVRPGFDAGGVLTVSIGLPFSEAQDHKRIYDALLEQIRAMAGIGSAAAISDLPLTEAVRTAPRSYPFRVAGRAPRLGGTEPAVALKFFMPGYFEVMRTRVVEGTGLAPGERSDVPHPVVVSAALARRLFPGQSPIGKRIRRLDSTSEDIWRRSPSGGMVRQPDYTIAGVVEDVREQSLRAAPSEVVYIPVLDPRVDPGLIPTEMNLVIRADVPPLMLAPAVRNIIRELDPALSVAQIRTMDAIVSASTAKERFLAVLLVIAGTASLLLGAVGIYGVVAYDVRHRSQEIGIRVALGARAGEVSGMVLRESFRIVLLGVVVGLAASLAATRVLRSFLFEVSPSDPATLAAVTALLISAATAASLLPARRAARVDPMVAMRAE